MIKSYATVKKQVSNELAKKQKSNGTFKNMSKLRNTDEYNETFSMARTMEFEKEENQHILKKSIEFMEDFDKRAFNKKVFEYIRNMLIHCNHVSYSVIEKDTLIHIDVTMKNFYKFYFFIKNSPCFFDKFDIDDICFPIIIQEYTIEYILNNFKNKYNIKQTECWPTTEKSCEVSKLLKPLIKEVKEGAFCYIKNKLSADKFFDILLANKNYIDCLPLLEYKDDILENLTKSVNKEYINKNNINRHFILHVGDTNSGKTYQALMDLKNAKTGVYLAPLRLLALEIQETLLSENITCSLLTGEEFHLLENATHMASTIEEMNSEKHYEVCVIDEAQMIDNEQRGWAWTKALYEIKADRIHVCMSKDALDIIVNIISICHDTYEIVEHKRDTELIFEDKPFNYPQDIKDYDALIVFSRKKVISIATELEDYGIKASILYGSLPYRVRKNELRKFQTGETKVIISTDAIGMGVNLPIKRVVFLESTKFDGVSTRLLSHKEVKQIAGRAGRKNIFDVGYVNAIDNRKEIKELLSQNYTPIKHISIIFPQNITNYKIPISYALQLWNYVPINDKIYKKCDIEDIIMRCQYLEEMYAFDKKTMLKFSTIPFDSQNTILFSMWKQLIFIYNNDLNYFPELPTIENINKMTFEELELSYKKCDLVTSFMRVCNTMEHYDEVINLKEYLTKLIISKIKLLKKQVKRCTKCGKLIPISSQYNICSDCHYTYYTMPIFMEDF